MHTIFKFVLIGCVLILSSCGAYFNQPMDKNPSRTGEFSESTRLLLDLPAAESPVEVAVYNFSDQTGQYKAIESGSTFSTAVSQGATTILIKALEDSGWFIPIERENLSNLSTERNIIRNTKQEYIKNLNPDVPPLPPLLYAGLLLEGGIISYDTNIITGGVGARYFGIGGSAKYRQDRITVYLRAVSTSNGEILKTIYVSKTILSQAVDASFFRFVKFQRLLEAETGFTQNEPVQLAVKDAIEKAVHDLVIEGIIDKYWATKAGPKVDEQLVNDYLQEKKDSENSLLYERLLEESKFTDNFSVSGGGAIIDGDYSTKQWSGFASLQYQKKLFPFLRAGINANIFQLKNKPQFSGTFLSLDLNAQLDILPKDELAPFVYAGPGMTMSVSNENKGAIFYKMQLGAGVEYHITQQWGLVLFGEQNIMFSDDIDMLVQGKRKDYYYNFGFGINYYFNSKRGNVNKTLY
jgi:curli production assembly/transport component CsgG